MENLIGVLRVKVIKGINLVIRDAVSSDPYVILSMGKYKVRTRTVYDNCNPVWDDEVSLAVHNLHDPIKISVYDKDMFTRDDKMGDAIIDIQPYIQHLRDENAHFPDGTVVHKVKPSFENSLAEDSLIIWEDGKLVQKMIIRLNHVKHGDVQLQLEWVKIPGHKGL